MQSNPDSFAALNALAAEAESLISLRDANQKRCESIDRDHSKPKHVTEKPTCKSIERKRFVAATSMNDILETARATLLWNDPQYKRIFQQMSTLLNSPR